MSTQYNADQNQVKVYYPSNPDQSQPAASSYQPMGAYQVTSQPTSPITDHLGWSICNTICCIFSGFFVLFCSIPALICSCRAKDLALSGRYEEARNSANCSRMLNIFATIFVAIGFLAVIVIIIVYVGVILAAFAGMGVALNEIDKESNGTFWKMFSTKSPNLE